MNNIYAIKDHEAGTFSKPMVIPTKRDAIEGFRQVVNQEGTDYNKFPKDFTLVELGMFSERTGLFDTIAPKTVIHATELVAKSEE